MVVKTDSARRRRATSLVSVCVATFLASCGGDSPRDFTCRDVQDSSEKSEQLARAVLTELKESATDKLMGTVVERANQTCGARGGSKPADKPFAELVDLIKLEISLAEQSEVETPETTQETEDREVSEGVDLLNRLDRLPGLIKAHCSSVVDDQEADLAGRAAVAQMIEAMNKAASEGYSLRDLAERALNAFDKFKGKCEPGLRQRVIDAVTGG